MAKPVCTLAPITSTATILRLPGVPVWDDPTCSARSWLYL